MILKTTLDCGSLLPILDICKFALTIIQWAAPILLILWGSIDLIKAVVAGKEDDIKKNQKTLTKRLISAVIIFVIPVGVSLLLGLIGSDDWKCCWKQAESQIVTKEAEVENRSQQAETCAQDDF